MEMSTTLKQGYDLPDLELFLNADPYPTFIIAIDPVQAIPFKLLLCNSSFQKDGQLQSMLLAEEHASILFRSWAQAVGHWRGQYYFANRSWTSFNIQQRWKVVRASEGWREQSKPEKDSATPPLEEVTRRIKDARIADARLESLQRMMEVSGVGVFEYAPNGVLTRANESWYRLSSHPRDLSAHQDFSFMDLVYPPDVPLVMAQWNKLVQGIPVTFEMRWKAPKEGVKAGVVEHDAQWILSACVPVMDDAGNLICIAGNTIDIGAQKRVQEEALQRADALERARASEYKFAKFAELAPVAIYIFDPQKGMQYCNDHFFELSGLPRVNFQGVDWAQIIYPDDVHIVEAGWKVLLEEKKGAQTQFRLKKTWNNGDGVHRQCWAQGQSFPELDLDGNVKSILGTLIDISRFKWAEDMQRIRVEEALEAKRQQENFIDMTSHEMRNPLSAVVQCADSTIESIHQISKIVSFSFPPLLCDDLKKVQEEIRTSLDALQTIISCSLHQKRIIDDILTLSKLDSNLILITPIKVQPVAVVLEAVKMFEVECAKDTIKLTFREDASLSSTGADWVMLDPSRLLQVLINLLTNAIKFTRDRRIRNIEVSLGATDSRPPETWDEITFAPSRTVSQDSLESDEWGKGHKVFLWIKVEDTGCGLTPAQQGNLFARFSQATPRTHVQYGGSGLGLFISKSLTELQSGCIGVRSESGVGSTFAFFVGTRISPPPDSDPVQDLGYRSALERARLIEENVKAAHHTVLIVEDNLVNQRVLSKQLQKAGCDVHVAGHGEEALAFLRRTKCWRGQTATGLDLSIMLLDIEMPVMDGLTCARKIRELQRAGEIVKHIPILAVSANARSEQIAQARAAGMDDAIAKPFRIAELLPKIEMLAYRR